MTLEADSTDLHQTWKFSQCFGDKGDVENITEADVISAVEFDESGNYLATGDKGGRVVLFERNENKMGCEYKFYTEFQSHDAEFDYLKSLEIEEKINKIKWCNRQSQAHFLLSTNDKTIKLWKVYNKDIKVVAENNLSDGGRHHQPMDISQLRLPRTTLHETVVAAAPRRIYANAHTYHINSISVNSDNETFLSADDLRINLWNLGIADQSFNIVNLKPANMEELTQVITSAQFHPTACNLFAYSTSKGCIRIADMRENSLCDTHSKVFEEWIEPSEQSFFAEITGSISDMRFSYDGRYIVSRDFMSVKIWDMNMEREPIKTIYTHKPIRDLLCDTYENDSIFDRFEVVFSGDSKSVMTGTYNNNFLIYPNAVDPSAEDVEIHLQADKSAFKAKKVGIPVGMGNGMVKAMGEDQPRSASPRRGLMRMNNSDFEKVDFKKNILHLSWHPHENSIAIAATNNLFVFSTL